MIREEETLIDPVSLVGLAGAPLVIALVALARDTFPGLATRYVPALTLGISIGLNVLLAFQLGTRPSVAVLVGLVTGLAASGLYSHVTTVMGK